MEIKEKILDYIFKNLDIFENRENVEIKEVGDGNVNYIFRVKDEKKSVIVKFSDDYIRGSTTRKLSSARSKIETEILNYQWKLSNGLVPEIYDYSEENSFIIMEDLSDYKVLRESIKLKEIYKGFGKEVAKFLYNTLFKTTDLVMNIKEKKETVARFVNYDMCEISERLVFTEPYMNNQGLNSFTESNRDFIEQNVVNNKKLILEVAKLKLQFMTNSESMIHGDLHSGSIFINSNGIKVFDPEFAFYGPMGYDIGNILASLIISYNVAFFENNYIENDFTEWLKQSILEIVSEFKKIYKENSLNDVNTYMFKNEEFLEYYLNKILRDTAGYAGTEIIRRTVGVAKVIDIDRVKNHDGYKDVERKLLSTGIDLILNSDKYIDSEVYKKMLEI
ncbi:S-methyl-5-thioribose kinase [Helcococcus kunzii]|uniref:S-methyl-5-thioribose kinase n=1 Tax=Helcococcus kunzii TaxID=40091 RepID=UPI0021A685F2|nr:S-methyl-5-thioribose kinase [Helcococcus kunzii]MCT1796071.1 S-methyl-5-thioribose kinase [Helcococcus kunzii]MCT1989766.1 S-methyl-5-thioribose kinase [Helcococcus kunzii]